MVTKGCRPRVSSILPPPPPSAAPPVDTYDQARDDAITEPDLVDHVIALMGGGSLAALAIYLVWTVLSWLDADAWMAFTMLALPSLFGLWEALKPLKPGDVRPPMP